jgi:hypothetical protein
VKSVNQIAGRNGRPAGVPHGLPHRSRLAALRDLGASNPERRPLYLLDLVGRRSEHEFLMVKANFGGRT